MATDRYNAVEAQISYLYMATCISNGKSYIGQSRNPIKRILEHIRTSMGNNTAKQKLIHKAIRKYGIHNFQWEIIQSEIPIEKINETEISAILLFNTKNPYGYNVTDGGEGLNGTTVSEETRKKMSESRKKYITEEVRQEMKKRMINNTFNLGNKQSEETKSKISKANLGKKRSDEFRKHLQLINTGKTLSEDHRQKLLESNIGKKHSEETKAKIGSKHKGKKLSEETKQKIRLARLGKKLSDEHKLKPSQD